MPKKSRAAQALLVPLRPLKPSQRKS